MIYSEHKKVVPLQKDKWYRVELLQEPSNEDERVNTKTVSSCPPLKLMCWYKATLSLRLDGATILRADIDDVDDIVNMWAAPRRGKPPAPGQVRAISVVTSEDQEEFGVTVEPKRKKPLQGQHEQLTIGDF